ncbi:hypothetical protein [Moraxella lacunata]
MWGVCGHGVSLVIVKKQNIVKQQKSYWQNCQKNTPSVLLPEIFAK